MNLKEKKLKNNFAGRDITLKDEKIPVIAVVGPTASGKTKLAIEICKKLNGEVVSADSIQIYKQMNIASAKPSVSEMDGIAHHLIDICDISCEFSVAEYVLLARKCINKLHKANKLPVICGGTGLYVDSLIKNINFSECTSDENLRKQLLLKSQNEGSQVLIDELKKFDPDSAETIHPNNIKRLIRAIEIYKLTGITMTEHIKNSKNNKSEYSPCFIGLTFRDRDILYDRINKRVDLMFEQGLVDEAQNILKSNYSKTSMNAIGYKEFIPFFNHEISLLEVKENIKRQTRRYAKRQLTWFKRNKDINWIYVDEQSEFSKILDISLNHIMNSGILK